MQFSPFDRLSRVGLGPKKGHPHQPASDLHHSIGIEGKGADIEKIDKVLVTGIHTYIHTRVMFSFVSGPTPQGIAPRILVPNPIAL